MSIQFKVGMQIRVKTRTKDNTFGTCIYELVDLYPNNTARFVMLHGTGASARPGYPVIDNLDAVLQNIADGITEIVPEADWAKNKGVASMKSEVQIPGRNGAGIEM